MATDETMQQILSKKADSVAEKTQVLLQAGRTVMYDQGYMLHRIHHSMPELKELITQDSLGHVVLQDPDGFQKLFHDLMNQNLADELAET